MLSACQNIELVTWDSLLFAMRKREAIGVDIQTFSIDSEQHFVKRANRNLGHSVSRSGGGFISKKLNPGCLKAPGQK